jgi:hypothetical protein
MRRSAAWILPVLALVAGCTGGLPSDTISTPTSSSALPARSSTSVYTQRAADWPVPDRHLTPGAITTVETDGAPCVPGHRAQSYRNVPAAEKRLILALYLITGKFIGEFDHLVPFSLCGSNGPKNVWPEPYDGAAKAYSVLNHKDELEAKVSARFHAKKNGITAAQAQAIFLDNDWRHEWCLLVHGPGVDCRGV